MGSFSITGELVYSGKSAPGLTNKYIYADYVSRRICQLEFVNKLVSNKLLIDTDLMIATFGVNQNDELYIADYKNDGKLYKFVLD